MDNSIQFDPDHEHYVEISTRSVLSAVAAVFSKELNKNHSPSFIVKLDDDKFLVKFSPDFFKKRMVKA